MRAVCFRCEDQYEAYGRVTFGPRSIALSLVFRQGHHSWISCSWTPALVLETALSHIHLLRILFMDILFMIHTRLRS